MVKANLRSAGGWTCSRYSAACSRSKADLTLSDSCKHTVLLSVMSAHAFLSGMERPALYLQRGPYSTATSCNSSSATAALQTILHYMQGNDQSHSQHAAEKILPVPTCPLAMSPITSRTCSQHTHQHDTQTAANIAMTHTKTTYTHPACVSSIVFKHCMWPNLALSLHESCMSIRVEAMLAAVVCQGEHAAGGQPDTGLGVQRVHRVVAVESLSQQCCCVTHCSPRHEAAQRKHLLHQHRATARVTATLHLVFIQSCGCSCCLVVDKSVMIKQV